MKTKRYSKLLIAASFFAMMFAVSQGTASADTTNLSPYSWDPGLFATKDQFNDVVHAWGSRQTDGAWGTGPVNYQTGATTRYRGNSSGRLNVVLHGTYCPGGQCVYGSGSGYKSLVQFWNDPDNYIAFGLINDPGVSPNGITIMIEGAGNGQPVGGYWPAGAISGVSHLFTLDWTASGITVTIDNQVTLGPYPVAQTNPSISFLAAARDTGDIADTTFRGINFSSGSVVADPIIIPTSTEYVSYTADINDGGTGTGHSAYINVHDAYNNALGVGIQSDTGSPESRGDPWYIWQRVQNGIFTYQYIKPASTNTEEVTLKWWQNENVAVFYENGTPIANISINLVPRLFFNAEGNARLNGDSVNSTIENVDITVGTDCPTYCGLNGTWNTADFNFYGLTATQTNTASQNGANFSITGTATGIPPGLDWDTTPDPVAGIGMIAQYWNGL